MVTNSAVITSNCLLKIELGGYFKSLSVIELNLQFLSSIYMIFKVFERLNQSEI